MKTSKFMRLLGLTDLKLPAASPKPAKQKFKALNANPAAISAEWERQRGDAARVAAAILRLDSEALLQRLGVEAGATQLYQTTAAWLAKEAATLRKLAKRVDVARNRLEAVIARQVAEQQKGSGQQEATTDHVEALL